MTQPRYRTQAGYTVIKKIKSVSLHELNPSLLPQHTKNKDSGQWCKSPNSHEDRQKQGIQHVQQVVHTGENPQICVDFTTTFFFSVTVQEENLLRKKKMVPRSQHYKSTRINTTPEQHLDLALLM